MSSPSPLKVLFVGPSRSRKSQLVTFLAGGSDTLTGSGPGPTVGARIKETDRGGAPMELWDVAGDQAHEACWPAAQKGADAIVLVYDPAVPGATKEIELWAEWFISRSNIPSERCACYNLSVGGNFSKGGG